MHGKLIVIEGTDGSGKTTQLGLLEQFLKSKRIHSKSLSFPQYNDTFFGKTIAKFLRGEIAPLDQINPYLISMVYAMDRAEAKDKLYRWLNHGDFVILNRYVTSNMAHQASRLPKKEVSEFLRWLDELEYKVNNVPREDLVIYLHVPYEVSLKLMQNEDRKNRDYNKGKSHDIVEKDKEYLQNAEAAYENLAKKLKHWVKIECVDENGEMKSKEAIHTEIVAVLIKKHILDF